MDDPISAWLTSLIPSNGLSPAQDRVFTVICDNHQLASFSDVAELAAKAGVDNSTVVRCAQSLGFKGWPSLQQELRARYLTGLTSEQTLAEHDHPSAGHVHDALRSDIANLTRSLETIDADAADAAIAALVTAPRLAVAAMGSSVGPATVFAHLGATMGYSITLEGRGGINLATTLNTLSPGDAVVIINLWRPIRDLVAAATAAHDAGITVVVVTDMRRGRLAALADHALIVPSEGINFFQSTTSAMSVVYGLLAGMQAARPDETKAAINRIQGLWRDIGTYAD